MLESRSFAIEVLEERFKSYANTDAGLADNSDGARLLRSGMGVPFPMCQRRCV